MSRLEEKSTDAVPMEIESFGTSAVSPKLERIVVRDEDKSKSGGYGQIFIGKDEYGREDGTVIKLIKGYHDSDLHFISAVLEEYELNRAAFQICRCTPEPSKIWFEPDFALFSMTKLTEIPREEFTVEMYGKIDKYLTLIERHGIIHGDPRIGNVMKDSMGEPKLIDFGFSVYSDDPLGIFYDHFFLAYDMSLKLPNKQKDIPVLINIDEYLALTEDTNLKRLYRGGDWAGILKYLQKAWIYIYRRLKMMEYLLDNINRIKRLISTGKFLPFFEGGINIEFILNYYRKQLQEARGNIKWKAEIQKRYDYAVEIGKRIETETEREWGKIDEEIKRNFPAVDEGKMQMNSTQWNAGFQLGDILKINLRLPLIALFLSRHYILQYMQMVPDISPKDIDEIVIAGTLLAAEDLKISPRHQSITKLMPTLARFTNREKTEVENVLYRPDHVLEIASQMEKLITWRYK